LAGGLYGGGNVMRLFRYQASAGLQGEAGDAPQMGGVKRIELAS